MFAIAAILWATAEPTGAQPAAYCAAEGVETADGTIRLARQWKAVFEDSFEGGLGDWRVENYEGKLVIEPGDGGFAGGCALVANRGAAGDTAWELASRQIAVTPGVQARLSFRWRTNRSLERLSGHQGHYLTELQWLSALGEEVGVTPFAFGKASDDWQLAEVAAQGPDNAAEVVIRFGCDQPNIEDGQFLALDEVKLEVLPAPPTFAPSGFVVSRPLPVAGERRLSWQADLPQRASLRFTIAGAPDADGTPGKWTPFVGPDGSEQTAFTQAAPLPDRLKDCAWLRYCAELTTDDPMQTPTLKAVSLGGGADGPWSGPDTDPPTLTERSPTRTADAQPPIWFAITDATGIDASTLRAWLDGAEITPGLVRRDGRYVYALREPLKPPLPDMTVARWRIDNYSSALTITRAPRAEDRPLGLHITREVGEVDTAFCLTSPPIPVEPGAKYTLSYWSRHSMDLSGAMNGASTYSGGVTWLDATGAPIGERVPVDLGPADAVWHQDRSEMTAPPGAVSAQIRFGFDTPNLFGGASVDIAEVALDGPHPQRPDAGPNLHRIAVRVADFAGNVLQREWRLLIRPPQTQNVVSLRDDGTVLIDGRPFFPIGLYAVWKKPFNDNSFDKAFGDLKAAGFNLAHTYSSGRGPDFTEFYAAAARHGIKLYVSSGAGANCTDVDRVLDDVVQEEAEPALLAWYLADDTASHVGPADLSEITGAIHDIDPAHITVQADGVGSPPTSRYAGFVNATDGFLPELYPIRDDSDQGVPRIIADMETVRADLAKSGARGRTIWPIIQYFQGWGWPRYPTREELWAMSYLSIIYGANGITWYTYGGWGDNHGVTDSPEVWKNICDLGSEISRLQDVLVEPTGPQPAAPQTVAGPLKDGLGYPSLNVLLKQHAGKRYLLAANSARAEVTARFALAAGERVTLPFENREITADAAGFQDTFGPYGVHVYVW